MNFCIQSSIHSVVYFTDSIFRDRQTTHGICNTCIDSVDATKALYVWISGFVVWLDTFLCVELRFSFVLSFFRWRRVKANVKTGRQTNESRILFLFTRTFARILYTDIKNSLHLHIHRHTVCMHVCVCMKSHLHFCLLSRLEKGKLIFTNIEIWAKSFFQDYKNILRREHARERERDKDIKSKKLEYIKEFSSGMEDLSILYFLVPFGSN